jgi:hypothetical protein
MSKQPDKILLYGAGAAGKTVSLATIVPGLEEGGRLVIVRTERNAVSGLEKGFAIHKITPKPGQVITVFPAKKEKAFANLSLSVKEFQNNTLRNAKSGNSDSTEGREKFTYFQDILNSLMNFIGEDYVTGEEVKIGNVGELTDKDVLVIDGHTPIVSEVWGTIIGTRLVTNMGDYMPVQKIILDIMRNLHALECHVVLLAHEKQTYKEVSDGRNTTSVPDKIVFNAGCGEANYEQIIGCFTDLIRASSLNGRYNWDVRQPNVDARIRNVNIPDSARQIEPNFTKHGYFK